VIILAAGTSSRLEGKSKQLLKYKNETLLRNSVIKALSISDDIFVVLGHKKEQCEKELDDLKVNIIYNKEYKKGMGSSLSLGIENTKDFEYTMVMLCDQPFIPISHLKNLKKNIYTQTIISSQYGEDENPKVPAIFPKKYYNEISKLDADFGAKQILQNEKTINIKLDKSFCKDIDTQDDINLYLNK
jgi:molybdenum cofactor cytidylyltransferase